MRVLGVEVSGWHISPENKGEPRTKGQLESQGQETQPHPLAQANLHPVCSLGHALSVSAAGGKAEGVKVAFKRPETPFQKGLLTGIPEHSAWETKAERVAVTVLCFPCRV